MTYVKLPKSTTDYSSGIQSVNQLRDNFAADYVAFAQEHGVEEPHRSPQGFDIYPPSTRLIGRHSTPKVPRAIVRTAMSTSSYGVVTPGRIEAPPVVTMITRLTTGIWFIGLTQLIDFYAVCEAEVTSSTSLRVVIPRTGLGGNGAPIGIGIELYESNSGPMTLADFDFAAHIYGTA